MGKLSKIISMAFRLFGNVLGGAVVYHLILAMVFAYKQQFLMAVVLGSMLWFICFRWIQMPLSSTTGKLINGCVQMLFVVAWIQMFFGIFESLIQSFVIAMLSMTYLALSVKHDRAHDRKGIAWN